MSAAYSPADQSTESFAEIQPLSFRLMCRAAPGCAFSFNGRYLTCIVNEKITAKQGSYCPAPPLLDRKDSYSRWLNYCHFIMVFRKEYEFQLSERTKCLLVLACGASNFLSFSVLV